MILDKKNVNEFWDKMKGVIDWTDYYKTDPKGISEFKFAFKTNQIYGMGLMGKRAKRI